jgi:hypothetical protein
MDLMWWHNPIHKLKPLHCHNTRKFSEKDNSPNNTKISGRVSVLKAMEMTIIMELLIIRGSSLTCWWHTSRSNVVHTTDYNITQGLGPPLQPLVASIK